MEDKPSDRGGPPTYAELAAMVDWIARHAPVCPTCEGARGEHFAGCQLDAVRGRLAFRTD